MPLLRNSLATVEVVPFSSISAVTSKQVRVQNADEIITLKRESDLRVLASLLHDTGVELKKEHLVDYDWSKIRDLDFQEQFRERSAILKTLNTFQCAKCPDLLTHYGIVHQEQRLQETLNELEHNLSDLNLELLPEYHQRIDVLKDLQFVDENSIVQVKG